MAGACAWPGGAGRFGSVYSTRACPPLHVLLSDWQHCTAIRCVAYIYEEAGPRAFRRAAPLRKKSADKFTRNFSKEKANIAESNSKRVDLHQIVSFLQQI